MNGLEHPTTCPKCGSRHFKSWLELTHDELFVAKRQPMSARYTDDERRRHRICTQCWFESAGAGETRT